MKMIFKIRWHIEYKNLINMQSICLTSLFAILLQRHVIDTETDKNLKLYTRKKREVVVEMMSEISKENYEMYKETFDCFCHNKGNKVWIRKLEQLLHCVGYNPTVREMREYMSVLDTKDKEEMDFEEFTELMKKVEKISGKPQDQVTDLVKAFKHFDSDGSGYLERGEIRKFLNKKGIEDVSDDDVEYILAVADKNNDGKIDITEFSKLLSSF